MWNWTEGTKHLQKAQQSSTKTRNSWKPNCKTPDGIQMESHIRTMKSPKETQRLPPPLPPPPPFSPARGYDKGEREKRSQPGQTNLSKSLVRTKDSCTPGSKLHKLEDHEKTHELPHLLRKNLTTKGRKADQELCKNKPAAKQLGLGATKKPTLYPFRQRLDSETNVNMIYRTPPKWEVERG
mgnify:CR=1 FL=1